MKPSGSRPPFFCVHAIFGSVFPYHHLAMLLPVDQPFYGLQARGLDGRHEPLERIEEMASAYIEAMRTVQPRGPYSLGGYSFGGLVAYEMAQQLFRRGEHVAVLAMLGTGAPPTTGSAMNGYLDLVAKYLEDFRRLAVNTALSDRIPGAEAFAGAPQVQTAHLPPTVRVLAANTLAGLRYHPSPCPGGLDVFVTADQQAMSPLDPSQGWKTLCAGKVETHLVAGNHLSMFQVPEVQDLAQKLTARLRGATEAPPAS
jgi:thioesterase domain-containing protein